MVNRAILRQALICGAICGVTACASAQSVSEYAVLVSAQVQTNPPQIELSWPVDVQATGYTIYRKLRDDTAWGAGILLAANAANFTDNNVAVGGAYEYDVNKTLPSPVYSADGYIYAGINVPGVTARGSVVLIVDNTVAPSLAIELTRLQEDLVGDGWTVLRHDVPRMAVDPANSSTNVWAARSNELASVKALIAADYNADPADVKAVFLFGHVPVPYSGFLAPDGHYDHVGAWPADAYYGDIFGTWTDSSVNQKTASDPRNWNVPGDGKFDQSSFPANITLQVGRVDLSNLPSFPQSETELLRQYLNKDHNFRLKLIAAQRRGLIDDNFGTANGEAFAADGWRSFAPFFGITNIATGNWLGSLSAGSYLWGYGCGGGTYNSAGGVASTADFSTTDTEVVFTMLFGSYFGDWNSPNNFMRAQLGTATYSLTSVWAGRPWWEFHHMALGETIGFSTLMSQNNLGLYSGNPDGEGAYSVHIALMGDPTLRLHPVAPPSALLVATNGVGGVGLSWIASPDTVLGYHVYRAATAAGPFTRLSTSPITATTYTDPVVTSNVYMVRAVKLEVSASGTYTNASQGIFQSLNSAAIAPGISLLQPTNNAQFITPVNIPLSASVFDPANAFTNIVFYANGAPVAQASGPLPYAVTWSNAPPGNYSVTAGAISSGGLAAISGAVNVTIGPSTNSPPVATNVVLQRCQNNRAKISVAALLAGGSDPNNGVLTLMSAGPATTNGGTVLVSNHWILYTPPPGSTNSDAFSYVIVDSLGLQATGWVSIPLPANLSQSQNIVATNILGNGDFVIQFQGIPGYTYTIQCTESLQTPVWQTLGTSTADATGAFAFTNAASGSSSLYYRSTYP